MTLMMKIMMMIKMIKIMMMMLSSVPGEPLQCIDVEAAVNILNENALLGMAW